MARAKAIIGAATEARYRYAHRARDMLCRHLLLKCTIHSAHSAKVFCKRLAAVTRGLVCPWQRATVPTCSSRLTKWCTSGSSGRRTAALGVGRTAWQHATHQHMLLTRRSNRISKTKRATAQLCELGRASQPVSLSRPQYPSSSNLPRAQGALQLLGEAQMLPLPPLSPQIQRPRLYVCCLRHLTLPAALPLPLPPLPPGLRPRQQAAA